MNEIMENEYEISSSSLSFASMIACGPEPETEATPDYLSLSKLSSGLERLLTDPGYDYYTDAEVLVDGVPVGVHRCLLAARSDYFHRLFRKPSSGAENSQKPRYHMPELNGPEGSLVGVEAFNIVLNYLYTGRLKQSPPEVSTCIDDQCVHEACRPAIDYAVGLMYAATTFQIKELVMLSQRRLLSLVDKALIEDVIPILVASCRCNLEQLLSCCIHRVAESDLDTVSLEKEIPLDVRCQLDPLLQFDPSDDQKRIRKIHKALDSDDVELIERLLEEDGVKLDDAFALHYAAAYSAPMVFKKVLDMKKVDLNLKNPRGLTALHVAARRKIPSIIVALLENGASVLDTTPDGQTALRICRRLTRRKDNEDIQKGRESNKNKMCIDLLAREVECTSMSGRRFVHSAVTDDDLQLLEYLESRVRMAKMLFPAEARTAMEIAGADWTPIYKGLATNEALSPERLQQKLQALRKTVEIGKRYFPNCSEEIVKFIDDPPNGLILEEGTEEERNFKRARFKGLLDDVQRAFHKDKAVNNPTSSYSSSSSSSPRDRTRNKVRVKG